MYRPIEQRAGGHRSFTAKDRGMMRTFMGEAAAVRGRELFSDTDSLRDELCGMEAVVVVERRSVEHSKEISPSPYTPRRVFSAQSSGFDGDTGVYGNAAKED